MKVIVCFQMEILELFALELSPSSGILEPEAIFGPDPNPHFREFYQFFSLFLQNLNLTRTQSFGTRPSTSLHVYVLEY